MPQFQSREVIIIVHAALRVDCRAVEQRTGRLDHLEAMCSPLLRSGSR